jgi:Glycine zipper
MPGVKVRAMKSRLKMVVSLYTSLIAASVGAQSTPTASPPTSAGQPGSPSASIGLFVNPKSSQSTQQQAEDEKGCYATAQQQTGIDPTAPASAPSEAAKKQGGGAKGAAGGAAGGAAIGAIAGDAGTGAAIGATAGAVRGRRQQKKANKQAEQQAAEQAQAQQQQKLETFRRAFSSCIDAKGYSVK